MRDRTGERAIYRAGRLLLAGLLTAGLLVIVGLNTARAFNIYQDIFVTLSARPLAMGGAFCAVSGPESVFYNPAGLAGVRHLRFLHNHSARHFPGSTEGGAGEWDQLDGDTQAVVAPLPLATYAHGFTFSGEMGYDYRGHPSGGSLGYPREQYWGSESYDAVGLSAGLPLAVGASLRRHFGRFTPDINDPQGIAWSRIGEGTQWGVLARVWPGIDYGYSELKMDYDWTLMDSRQDAAQAGWPTMESRLKHKRSGWALHPAAWLTLAADNVSEVYKIKDGDYLGALHTGDATHRRSHAGGELCLGALAKLRWGDYDGHPTVGAALNVCGIWVNYAEVKDLLPLIVGAGDSFKNIHIYGFDWQW